MLSRERAKPRVGVGVEARGHRLERVAYRDLPLTRRVVGRDAVGERVGRMRVRRAVRFQDGVGAERLAALGVQRHQPATPA